MASPTIIARTEDFPGSVSSDTTSFAQTTGNLVVIFIATVVAKDISAGDSFVRLTPSGSHLSHIFYKVLDGSEGGNVVLSWTTATRAVVLSWEIQGHSTTQMPEVSTEATGTSNTPDPGTVTPTGGAKDYLWLAMFNQDGEEADDDTWCNSAPTNFGNLFQKSTGTGGAANTNTQSAGADFASNASSMNPDTFSTDQSLGWRAFTVAVHPAEAGEQFTQSLSGALSFSGATIKKTKRILTAVLSFSVTITKKTKKVLAATLSTAGATIKKTKRILSGVLSFSATVFASHKFFSVLTASLSFSATTVKKAKKSITASISPSVTFIKDTFKGLAANVTFGGAIEKKTKKLFNWTQTFTTQLDTRHVVYAVFTATVSFVGTVTKKTTRLIVATVSFVGTTLRRARKTLSAVLSFTTTLNRRALLQQISDPAFLTFSTVFNAGTQVAVAGVIRLREFLKTRITTSHTTDRVDTSED